MTEPVPGGRATPTEEDRSERHADRRSWYDPSSAPVDYYRDLGDPGEYPFTRGRLGADSGDTSRWIQRELSGEGSPLRSNAQLHALLDRGAQGVDVIGDNPTVSALDPDHPMCAPAVGTTGVSLCRKQDFVELLDGIPLESMTVSYSLPAAFAMSGTYLAGLAHGVEPRRMRGSAIQAPLYCEDCAYATFLPYGLRMRLALDSITFALEKMPRFHGFLEDTYYISDGGLDVVEEMSLGFLEIREICRGLLDRGLSIDAFAPRIAILVNCRMSLFEEIAKIRATRRIFARMMRDEFHAKDSRSWSVNIAVHTSGLSLTAAQPANNIVRGALQGLAMALAGVQGLEISTFDEPFRTPSAIAHEVAIRTQQVIMLESGVADVKDPLGGSYYMEALTDDLERRISGEIQRIESLGPVTSLVESGYFRGVFTAAMDRHLQAVQSGRQPLVGVNVHTMPREDDRFLRDVAETRFLPDAEHVERVRRWRRDRDHCRLQRSLSAVSEASAEPAAGLMEPILAALEAEASIGEITGELRTGQGMPADPFEFAAHRSRPLAIP